MRKLFIPLLILCTVALVGITGCAPAAPTTPPPPPPTGPPKAPTVTLNRMEVPVIEALALDFPTGYTPDKVGFFLLAAVFDIENPNDYPVMLDEIKGIFALKGGPGDEDYNWFELNAPFCYDDQWIPAKTTNQARLTSLFTTRTVQLSLLVAQGWKVSELGTSWDKLEKVFWGETVAWKSPLGQAVTEIQGGIGEFAFPVKITGSAAFTSAYGDVTSSFSETFP